MEAEICRFIIIWASAILGLCYCNVVSVFVRKGMPRLMAITPVILFFAVSPLYYLHTVLFGPVTVFCLSWIANFKLLLLTFDTGPLSDSSLSLVQFVSLACLPIIKASSAQDPPTQNPKTKKPQTARNGQYEVLEEKSRLVVVSTSNDLKSPLHYARRAWALPFIPSVYAYRESIHPVLRVHIYTYYMCIILEMEAVTIAMLAQWLLKMDLEQPFNEPYLSTSLRDFWGRRWNLISTKILRSTIFSPIFQYTSKTLGHAGALIFSIMGTFLVSALMHALLYYQVFRVLPSWSFLCFFVFQGLCLIIEGAMRSRFATIRQGFRPPFIYFFLMSTFAWLVMSDMVEQNADTVLFLTSFHLGYSTVFCLSWVANFKLLLLSFGTGPLSDPSLPLSHFLTVASLPVIISQKNPTKEAPKKNSDVQSDEVAETPNSVVNTKSNALKPHSYYFMRAMYLPSILFFYAYRESINPNILIYIYMMYVYTGLEFVLAMCAIFAQSLLGVELEQPFDQPLLSTSLADYWGKRWNLISTDILRLTIFRPIYRYISRKFNSKLAYSVAIMTTFFVSGLMHELLDYHIFRTVSNWGYTYFFLMHGLCVVIEGELINKFGSRWHLPQVIAGPILILFVSSTFIWLVNGELMQNNMDAIVAKEYMAAIEFLMSFVGLEGNVKPLFNRVFGNSW
ncbi:hypothetical protein ACET3Z_032816 [Daucus carota]